MKPRRLTIYALILLLSANLCSAVNIAGQIRDNMVEILCMLFYIIVGIAGALGTLMIVLAGLKWVGSRDDPAQRKQALEKIKDVAIGLLVILVALGLINMIIAIRGAGYVLACT